MEADVTPEALENHTFATKLRGYDPDEVHSYLARVAVMLRDQQKHADRAYQAVGEEMGEMLQQARDRADAMIAAAEAEAADLIAGATAAAEKTRSDAEAGAAATRAAAEEDATRVRADAAEAAESARLAAQRDADDRTARADERVRVLVARENEARERIARLRNELLALTERLQILEDDGGLAGARPEHEEASASRGDMELEPATEAPATEAPATPSP